MRKLSIILGAIGLTTVMPVSVIACSSKQPDDPNQDLISSLITELTTASNTISNQITEITSLTTTNASLNTQLLDLTTTNTSNQDNITNLTTTISTNQTQLSTLYTTQGSLSSKIGVLTQQLATANTQLALVRTGTSWSIVTTDTTKKSLSRKFKNPVTGQWDIEKWVLSAGTSYALDRYVNGIQFDPYGTWTANNTSTSNYFAQLGFSAVLVSGATQWQVKTSTTNSNISVLALSSDEQVSALQNQLAVANQTISSNVEIISSLTTANQDLTTTVDSLTNTNTNQTNLITTLNQTITDQNNQISMLTISNLTLETHVNDLTTQLTTANTELTQSSNSNGWVIDSTDTTKRTITRTYRKTTTAAWQTEKVIIASGGTLLSRTIDGTSYPYQNAMNANEGTAQTFFKSLGFNLAQVSNQWVFTILNA